MGNDIESIIKTTLENINNLTDNEKLISTKISYDDSNYLAISKLNMNFVIGGSDIDKRLKNVELKPFAGAAYVNLTLNPQLLIYQNKEGIKTINIIKENSTTYDIANAISDIMSFVKDVKEKRENNEE